MTKRLSLLITAIVGVLSAVPAGATLVFTVQPISVSAGSTGNGLQVTLTNSGPSAVAFGGFSFEVTTADPDITFTSADFSTTLPYIFAGDSLLGPTISSLGPGQTMNGSDAAFSGSDSVGSGVTVGLGDVLFDVALNAAAGPFAVTFSVFPASSLSDPLGNNIPIDTLTSGNISITSTSSVPEPASGALLLGGLALLRWMRRHWA